MIKNIAFTVYAVTDIAKSRAFYEGVLGLNVNPEFDGSSGSPWVEYLIGDGAFAIGCSAEWKPSQDGASVAFETDDFDAFITKLKSAQITFKLEPSHYPTCSMAVIEDPDKNKVILHRKK